MRRRWLVALALALAVGACGSGPVENRTPSTATPMPSLPTADLASPTLVPEPSKTASPLPSQVASPFASPLGVVRIPFAEREMELTIVGEPGGVGAWRAAAA